MNVILSYGLGVDSTALLLRWLEDPDSRDFDLSDLLVVTSMTGDEWARTGILVQEHILPRLRERGIRFAQVARNGHSESDGIVVLDDTTEPRHLHLAGAYKLSDELVRAGTLPQVSGNRRCSMKFKGWVIDTYLADHAPGATRHAFGYESGELGRARVCSEAMHVQLALGYESSERGRARKATTFDTPGRVAEFPLIEWDWDREECRRYIGQITGVHDWPKSACDYCPFALTSKAGLIRTLERYDSDPQRAISTLLLERLAICLNPRSGLIGGDRFCDVIAMHRPTVFRDYMERLDGVEHSVYEVRRIWRPSRKNPLKVGNAARSLDVLACGDRRVCEETVRRMGQLDRADGIARFYERRRSDRLPSSEHFYVAAPAGAVSKERPSFSKWWRGLDQTELLLVA